MLAPLLALAALLPLAEKPLALHPDNPHYFLFRGEPAFLLTSGEHYGAVLNLDFDYKPYLDELHARGFNLTRTFSGTYREVPGSFKIRDNTLAPKPYRYCSPWKGFVPDDRKKAAEQGEDVEHFNLDEWNDAYFARLKDFIGEAGKRGIVVEYVLFCPLYEESLWDASPLNQKNNANSVGDCPREEVYTTKHLGLLARQLAFVKKAVTELNGFDNVYFEICNEPYFGGVTLQWQARIAAAIVEAERGLPNKHLIAQNIANEKAAVDRPDPSVSIFNFHYATPPATVAMNYGLNKVIADDETGFRGTDDAPYRREAWEFLLAGGGAFSNLDYSFTASHEDGKAEVKDPTPGGGGPRLREQFSVLKRFLDGFDFVKMKPDNAVIKGVPPGVDSVWALAERGKQYAVYLHGGGKQDANLPIDLPKGRYEGEWIDPKTGKSLGTFRNRDADEKFSPMVPEHDGEIALRIVARKDE